MNIAVILAGGSGTRLGGDCPKQFLDLAGKKVIEHAVEAFEAHPGIDEIAIVAQEEYLPLVGELVRSNGWSKVRRLLPGGSQRCHSSLSAIEAYQDDNDILLFHDAVRPLVSARIIDDCLAAMEEFNAVDVGVPATDTMIQVGTDGCIAAIPDRATLRGGQTPQCFRRGTIGRAYDLALADPSFATTCDCGVVHKYLPEEPVFVVRGEPSNMKLTYPEDLPLLEALLALGNIQK